MKNFRVEVSKGLERYALIRKSENENFLREELHKEGFAILTVQEVAEAEISGNKFFFEILEKNGKGKVGTIVSDDIFKAYIKIKYELKFDLIYIYQDQNTSLEEKNKIIKELEQHYLIYLEVNKKQLDKKEKEDSIKTKEIKEESTDTFKIKKELELVYKVIDKILEKLKSIIDVEGNNGYKNDLYKNEFLNFEKKQNLKNLYSELLKLKSSTNLQKIKQIGELALVKVGELELEMLSNKKSKEYQILLDETNKLLKDFGVNKTFIEKEKDIKYIFIKYVDDIKIFFNSIKNRKKRVKVALDTKSSLYLRNKNLLNKYETKLKKLNQENNILVLLLIPTKENKEKYIDYSIRKKVLEQNITLLKGRISGEIRSYTKLLKGYTNYIVSKIIELLNFLILPTFILIFIVSILFLLVNLLNLLNITQITINLMELSIFVYLITLYILIKLSKGLFTLSINTSIFTFLIIFSKINF